jgi:hypothetical protein
MGFKVTKDAGSAKKAKAFQRKSRAEDFVLLLADDAEKNFGKMIPFTQERGDRIAGLLEEVELDPIEWNEPIQVRGRLCNACAGLH